MYRKIVVGYDSSERSRAYGRLRRVLLGSVSAALARSAPCPLIVHPRPAKPPVHAGPHLAAAGAL